MGIPKTPQPVKLFFGLLASSPDRLAEATRHLTYDFSAVELSSEVIEFDLTDYYADEMGSGLLRQWVATTVPILPRELAPIKLHTNRLEALFSVQGKRTVNIDPGYVSLSKVVLATTKDYSHRIYVRDGIYEEVTLVYRRGSGFEPWPWTYPDYRSETAKRFFLAVRESLRAFYRSETIKPIQEQD